MENFSQREQDNYYIPYIDYRTPIKSSSLKVGASLLSQEICSLLLSLLFGVLVSQRIISREYFDPTTFEGQVFSAIFFIIMFILPIAVAVVLLRIPAKVAFPLRKPDADVLFGSIGISMGIVILGGIVVDLIYNLVANTTGYGPVYPYDYVPRGLEANVIYFISMAILPAFLEEFYFRGVIMQSLRRYGDSFALVVSSLFFGLSHGNLIQAPNAIIMGLLLGYFTLYSGSMWPAIAMHFVNNGLSVVIDWVSVGTTDSQDEMIGSILFVSRILIGIFSLVILKMRRGSLFYIPKSKYPLKESTKYVTALTTVTIILYFIVVTYFTIDNLEPLS